MYVLPRKEDLKFKVGSCSFFEGHYDNYVPHDYDFLVFSDIYDVPYRNMKHIRIEDYNIHNIPATKESLLEAELSLCETDSPMHAATVLSPEVCEYFGVTLEDINRFEPYIRTLTGKHEYLQMVYDAYVLNNAIMLTDEQRDDIYNNYKDSKKRRRPAQEQELEQEEPIMEPEEPVDLQDQSEEQPEA